MTRKVLVVVGARPNFMKVAPILDELARRSGRFETSLVHTGQHHDHAMSEVFFTELGMPKPDVNLGIGSGSHAEQTGRIMIAFEPLLERRRPDAVLVAGDVNSTLACALTAAKLDIQVAHIEAGLRSFDRQMPEEINRIGTDLLATWLFATEVDACTNLAREGIPKERVHLVGNTMIDTLVRLRPEIEQRRMHIDLGLQDRRFGLVTVHRPSNVDTPARLGSIVELLIDLARRVPLVFPAHPRTTRRLFEFGLTDELAGHPQLRVIDPLGYLDFVSLASHAAFVLTDSGGIQEETTVLGTPCLTMRENTERPVTVTYGTNQLVPDPNEAREAAFRVLDGQTRLASIPPLWDGRASERIVDILEAAA